MSYLDETDPLSMPSYEDIEDILDSNDVHAGWKDVFRQNSELRRSLHTSLSKISELAQWIPAKNNLLRALSRHPPTGIKVVILGYEPINNESLATGFAFSFPVGAATDNCAEGDGRLLSWKAGSNFGTSGASIVRFHDVLAAVGYIDPNKSYDCCHEVWAEDGVLMINASLTYNDFYLWKDFTQQLLLQVAELNTEQYLYFLCWKDNAEQVGLWLSKTLKQSNRLVQTFVHKQGSEIIPDSCKITIYIGDHPTWPRAEYGNCFKQQATEQFADIRRHYPELFTLNAISEPAADNKENDDNTKSEVGRERNGDVPREGEKEEKGEMKNSEKEMEAKRRKLQDVN